MSHEQSLDAPMRRFLKSLAVRGAWLELPEPAVGTNGLYRLMSASGAVAHEGAPIRPDVVSQAAQNGWLTQGEGRMTLTAAGARSLRRALAGGTVGPGQKVAQAAGRAASHQGSVRRSPPGVAQVGRQEPTEETAGLNEAESPLGWLRRRKDKDGQPLISDAQFAAGERLRADVFFAGLSPRTTASWSATAGTSSGRRAAPGGSAQMLDTMVAARQRVALAMRAVGPELSGILLDVCGFMKGLEGIEAARGWPPRSGKVVLLLALSRLAVHFGLSKPGAERTVLSETASSSRIRHWGSRDYRPDVGLPARDDDDEDREGDGENARHAPPGVPGYEGAVDGKKLH